MKLTVKHFSELSTEELFKIYKLRISVFVVEQHCPYQEADDADKSAYHLWLEDEDGIHAYARVLPPAAVGDSGEASASIGRVLAVKRRAGLGTRIVSAAIDTAKIHFSAESISIEAQTYVQSLYEKLGFCKTSEEFLLDGIPHIKMHLQLYHRLTKADTVLTGRNTSIPRQAP